MRNNSNLLNAGPGCDDVLDENDRIPRLAVALDQLLCAVSLRLLPHYHKRLLQTLSGGDLQVILFLHFQEIKK